MESISWERTQRRLTIYDRLATDEPGSLSSCSFSDLGDAFYDINNNNQQILSYYHSDYVHQFWPYMHETNNNDSETTKRSLRLSSLLATSEQDSVRHFVGKNAALLACGVCQLLEEKNGTWQLFGVGVICLIRDYDKKIFSLSLVDPISDGSPAYSMWDAILARNFITMKNHPHLISFELSTGFFGLNFSEDSEAEDFHRVVIILRQEYLTKQSIRKPKRRAPEPPPAPNEPIGHTHEETTSSGIEVPVVVVKEKKKRGFIRNIKSIFGEKEENKKKKKKNKTKPVISNPTNFQHLQHGLEGLSEEQKAMVARIMESGKFQLVQGEEEELHGLIKKAVIDNYDDLKVELEHRKREVDQKKEEPPINRQENEHTAFQRTTSNGLSEARSSLKIAKMTRGNTPRDIKKQSSVKKQENFNPFRADWDEEHQLPPTALAPPPLVEDVPPAISARTHSRRNNFIRQNTPPYSRFGSSAEIPPPLPPRLESSHSPQRPPSPPSVKLPPISTSAPLASLAPPAPPPPPLSLPKVNPPMAPPPPPPPSVLGINVEPPSSTLNVPNVTDGRRSFLDEIQNVDKSKLLRPVDRSPSRTDVTPIGKGLGILDSIQRELDIRRTVINSSSDDDSSDEEDSDSWSD